MDFDLDNTPSYNKESHDSIILDKKSNKRYRSLVKIIIQSRFMRIISTLLTLSALAYGAYYINETKPELTQQALEFVNTGTLVSLEARYTAKQIMETQTSHLLKDGSHTFGEVALRYHPYLLMEVKFTGENMDTQEANILWSMIDGEMVLDTRSWKKTHGFADCINCKADAYEYQILNTISDFGGCVDAQALRQSLNIESVLLSTWIDRCKSKKLIVQIGNDYKIHLQKPLLNVKPATQLSSVLVSKASKFSEKLAKVYTPSQIKRAASNAFGSHFAIRSTRDVFVPIYSIVVVNPDGSLHTTHWNAVSGKQVHSMNFTQ
ncbi:hypothetical protein COB21_03900 [Candidatus Aerophobetes bacterium]|uniref:Uncharacterized protein n=1 Tax=Aerophobetes bacterium TaxID=2030807 RepID=A0A2A4X412_UNCAE|nr:MAG: hypothetical protein COB21_03900 [Candidatus Aerophobetes bacterium]